MEQTSKQRRDQIEQEAALWVVRSSEPGAASEALEQWLAGNPEHALAYEKQLRAWTQASKALAPTRQPADRRPGLFGRRDGGAYRAASRTPLQRAAAVAAVAVLGVSAAGALWLTNTRTAYATGVGEHRVVRLQDGSRVELNTGTTIVVRYTLASRDIELRAGEALFEVMPNKHRPFNVMANNERVRAVGTAFNVRVRADGVDVLVSKGVVDVDPQLPSNGADHHRLIAGTLASFGHGGGAAHPVSAAEIERTLAWRYGAISLNGQTLKEAAAEFNRYNVHQLEVVDPQVADLKLGGYFRADDLGNFVQALKTTFGVEVTEGSDQTLYLSRARE